MVGSGRQIDHPSTGRSVPGLVPIEELLDQLVDRAGEVISAQDRLRRLLAANRLIHTELSLPLVLRRVGETARELVGAEYAALGVIGADGLLEQFIHLGLDSERVAAIGELPKGRGVLGALIEDPKAIRLRRIGDDERSSGFPSGHPEMTSFLGVPIRSRDEVYGNLYLTNHPDGEFSAADEDLVEALATTAGVAIENARLFEEARHRQQWLLASAEITAALLNPSEEREPLQMIADSVLRLADADVATVVLPAESPERLFVAAAAGAGAEPLRGLTYPKSESLVELALETGRGVRVGRLPGEHQHRVHLSQVIPIGAALAVPLLGKDGPHGAVVAGRRPERHPFGSADLEMAETFANQAAVAQELAAARADQQRLAVMEDRDRIARDLHDHVIQRLFAAGLTVQSVAAGEADPVAGRRLGQVVQDLDDTIRQIRTSIFQLRGSAVSGRRLRAAVLEVVAQVEASLGLSPRIQFRGPVDTLADERLISDTGAVVREALTNVAKHAQATTVSVQVIASQQHLMIEVVDNGVGCGRRIRSSGLSNLRRRAQMLGGDLALQPTTEGGTQLQWKVPL